VVAGAVPGLTVIADLPVAAAAASAVVVVAAGEEAEEDDDDETIFNSEPFC
jgi:hypothetical protein